MGLLSTRQGKCLRRSCLFLKKEDPFYERRTFDTKVDRCSSDNAKYQRLCGAEVGEDVFRSDQGGQWQDLTTKHPLLFNLLMLMLAQAIGRFLNQYRVAVRATRDCDMTTLTKDFNFFQLVGSGILSTGHKIHLEARILDQDGSIPYVRTHSYFLRGTI